MQLSISNLGLKRISRTSAGWFAVLALTVLLWAPVVPTLWDVWQGDPSLSHGPLVPLMAAALLWMRRDELQRWDRTSRGGLALLLFTALLHIAAVWADVEFLQPLSLIGMAAGAVWYFGGLRALGVAAGALGFLVFMIPWPTTVVERLAFPLQLTSSAYAALLGGLLGLPIVREGVHLHVVPNPDAAPVYSVLVAKQCSGLTSLMVLLALGYLIAYHTRVGLGWRTLLLALVVPLALFGNALRITFVLLAGTYHSAGLAQWVHDHESYVLIVLCCLGLLGLRHAILSWTGRSHGIDEKAPGQVSIISA